MIETYFDQVESILQTFPHISTYTLRKKVYNSKQGYIGGSITFENGYRLDFIQVKDVDTAAKLKYRYQYMDEKQVLIFRYDNAPHHKSMGTFPHHKHTLSQVLENPEPTLRDVLLEIVRMVRESTG